jgi:hypothetical protein
MGAFLAQVDAGHCPTRDPRAVTASITGMRDEGDHRRTL